MSKLQPPESPNYPIRNTEVKTINVLDPEAYKLSIAEGLLPLASSGLLTFSGGLKVLC